jgi:DNA invertase Pin-like site-specific DNA recombinase
MKYAYVRVSTRNQFEDRQLVGMDSLGIPPERRLIEKLSGKDTKRPKLQELMALVQKGDTVVVEEISRFARNTRDLLSLVEKLREKGVNFVSIKESIDTTTPTGKFVLTVFGAVAQMEREYMLQRQAAGIAAARARGVRFGRPIKTPPENFQILVKEWERGDLRFEDLLKKTGLKKATFYRRLREYKVSRKK